MQQLQLQTRGSWSLALHKIQSDIVQEGLFKVSYVTYFLFFPLPIRYIFAKESKIRYNIIIPFCPPTTLTFHISLCRGALGRQ